MSLSEQLSRIRPLVARNLQHRKPPYCLFFSLCNGVQRATVLHVTGATVEETWQRGARQVQQVKQKAKIDYQWLRVDWVRESIEISWQELLERLKNTKRNYFRFGLAFDKQLDIAFLEQEINGNAMLYGGNKIAHATINEKNIRAYARKRFGLDLNLQSCAENPVYLLNTQGIFSKGAEPLKILYATGRNAGRRIIKNLDDETVYELIDSASQYLTRQVRKSGLFNYGWHPCFDRSIATYNNLRHASTTYAMLESWEVTKDASLKTAIDRALHQLTTELIKTVPLPDGSHAAFLVDQHQEIKLGGNAVCLLALVKYSELTGDDQYLSLMELLAIGIQKMQNVSTGQFAHVLNYPDLTIKEFFRIIYYDGEAAFGLIRLYGLTRDPRWLNTVEKAFDYFIQSNHWKAHDHWLSYCVNEITRYRPEEKYYRFGIQNVAGYLDFVEKRITTFPTLLELMMAAEKMICRMKSENQFPGLLELLDEQKFYHALECRAHYLLNGHFWPEYAMYFKNPEKILGSFFIRHHSFRVRIDDVEHYLSGFIAYRNYLIEKQKTVTKDLEHERPH
ncbi:MULTISPECIES: glycoside hydrolase family 127 protein [Microbulbifer]|uniref:Glycoside hydrolase family 127 protein n=1 Tax=Microbulbifer celer TaxID=435905 RepID=A0ABW3UAS9_9GAMM|nr:MULTISPECIES: glycoside hydrolase family 127 protein [Microbulbifer]UFN55759.1 glycoside hydrolase family 127 protein [Microbulbifer celer]